MKVICLTGGMASGKSTASKFLQAQGAQLIDADKLGHRVYDPGTSGFDKVISTFGADLVAADGQIDRKALGAKVFGKPDELKKLTDIVWPEIRQLAETEISEYASKNPSAVVVLEAAVLFEAGWEDIGDEIWVVVIDREIAIERSIARDGFDRAAVESRLDSQLSNAERISKASLVIDNSKTAEDMQQQLTAEWQRLAN